MNVELIMPFLRSLENTFKMLLALDLEFHEPVYNATALEKADCFGIIEIDGDLEGLYVIKWPEPVISALLEQMTGGMKVEFGGEDFQDAVYEMVSMVSGSGKGEFQGMQESVRVNHLVEWNMPYVDPKYTPRIEVPCTCQYGTFAVELALIQPEAA